MEKIFYVPDGFAGQLRTRMNLTRRKPVQRFVRILRTLTHCAYRYSVSVLESLVCLVQERFSFVPVRRFIVLGGRGKILTLRVAELREDR